ncbi:MAG: hypothetical protein Q8Q26_02995, partial [Pseudorhodobacter sp.]|nr:hypothetical protein [Pseudorhodobacter sp.]
CSRRVCFFFIASRRPGKAGCFGIGRAPRRVAEVYQIRRKSGGFSDVPIVLLMKMSKLSRYFDDVVPFVKLSRKEYIP